MEESNTQRTTSASADSAIRYSDDTAPATRFDQLKTLLGQGTPDLFINANCGAELDESTFDARCHSMFGDDTKEAIRLILQNCNRFRTIDLLYAPFALELAKVAAPLDMSRLETLDLDIADSLPRNPVAPGLRRLVAGHMACGKTLFTDYPHLEHLQLCADTEAGTQSTLPEGTPPSTIKEIVIWNRDKNKGFGRVPPTIFNIPPTATIKIYAANTEVVRAALIAFAAFAASSETETTLWSLNISNKACLEYTCDRLCEVHAPREMLDGTLLRAYLASQ